MRSRRSVDEMTNWLQLLRDYVGGAAFASERRLACEEFFHAIGRAEARAVAETWCASHEPATVQDAQEALERRIAFSDWFLFHRCHSHWDRTPVRLFVEENPALPDHVRANLLACENSVGSVFAVVSGAADAVVVQDLGGDSSDFYRVLLGDGQSWIVPGEMVRARLVRWDEAYWFHGPVERWPASPRDVVGDELLGMSGDGEHLVQRRNALRFATRAGWLRDRRARP
jgi:hypothetical protein